MPARALRVGMVLAPAEDKYRGGRCAWILGWIWFFFSGPGQVHKNTRQSMETKGFLQKICFPELGPSPAHSHSICSSDKTGRGMESHHTC